METNQNQQMMNSLLEEARQQMPAPAPVEQQPPQPEEPSLELQLRAKELITQAHTIRAIANVDVLALYNTDVEVRNHVLNGEWDFIDVYKRMKPAHTPPAPLRSANGGAGVMNISGMDENQFDKLNAMLKKGMKVDMSY